MPGAGRSPSVSLLRRLVVAAGALVAAALVVHFAGGDGYVDGHDLAG
jgi:voltage-gated potassium channel